MAVSDKRTLKNGSDIMLFAYINGSYTSIAHGTSHSLSLSADTESINTKDAGIYGMNTVNKINWEISADHMYTEEGYSYFFNAMTYMQPFTVVFGLKDPANPGTGDVNISADGNWVANSSYIYSGQAVISSLNFNADAGSKATVSVSLQGQGEIKAGKPASPVAMHVS